MEVNTDTCYIVLLNELCSEYNIDIPEFNAVNDVTMCVTVGPHHREATASSQTQASNMAAEAMYKHLRCTMRSSELFHEGKALQRALDKQRCLHTEQLNKRWKPPITLKISDYDRGMILLFEEKKRIRAFEALQTTGTPEVVLTRAAAALDLEPIWHDVPSEPGTQLVAVELPRTVPSLVHYGFDRNDAASFMVDYLKLTLIERPTTPTESSSET